MLKMPGIYVTRRLGGEKNHVFVISVRCKEKAWLSVFQSVCSGKAFGRAISTKNPCGRY
jgi:hypothetical protein